MKTNLIHAALFTPISGDRWGLPLLLTGAPGIAKTATFRALGLKLGVHVEVLSPGERGEGAFGVTPVPAENGHGMVLEYPPPEWVRLLRVGKTSEEVGIVLIDEINSAPPALQPALMGAVQDRRIGGHQLGGRVRVMGAMNPTGHAAGGWDLAAPVANRFGHLDWTAPDADEWAAWLVGGSSSLGSLDVSTEEARVLAAWPDAWAKASGLVAAFIRRRPELLHKMPVDGDPAQSRAWPSPRTWEYATRALASASIHGLTEVEADELLGAFVGTEAAAEFVAWVETQDLPNPADLLDGVATFSHDAARLDRTAAILGACVSLVTPPSAPKRSDRVERLWRLLIAIMIDAKDLAVPTATALVKAKLGTSPAAKSVLTKLADVWEAAKDKGV